MILLAALLSFGWPALKTEWVPANTPCPKGMFIVKNNKCCGSNKPYLVGGETMYVEYYDHHSSIKGYIANTPYALHPVISENDTTVWTKGLANQEKDPPTSKRDVSFVVRYVLRP